MTFEHTGPRALYRIIFQHSRNSTRRLFDFVVPSIGPADTVAPTIVARAGWKALEEQLKEFRGSETAHDYFHYSTSFRETVPGELATHLPSIQGSAVEPAPCVETKDTSLRREPLQTSDELYQDSLLQNQDLADRPVELPDKSSQQESDPPNQDVDKASRGRSRVPARGLPRGGKRKVRGGQKRSQ